MFLAWGKGLQLDDFSEIPSSPTFSLILCLSFHDSNIRNSETIPERLQSLVFLSLQRYWYFHVQHGGILGLNREKHRENVAFLLFATPLSKKKKRLSHSRE